MAQSSITKTLGPIHFEDLDPRRFEDLVQELAYDFKDWQNIEALLLFQQRTNPPDNLFPRSFTRHPIVGTWVILKRPKGQSLAGSA